MGNGSAQLGKEMVVDRENYRNRIILVEREELGIVIEGRMGEKKRETPRAI